MHNRFRYSFLAFFVSASLHAGLWGFIVTYKAEEKPKPVEKIAMQVAMFKQAIIPQPTAKSEPTEEVKESPVEKKTVSTSKPVFKPEPKKAKPKKIKPKKVVKKTKPKKKPRKKIKKKIKKKVVKKKVVKKKPSQKTIAKKSVKPKKPPQKYQEHKVQKHPAPKQHRQVAHNARPHKTQQAHAQSRQATGASKPKAKPRARPTPVVPQRATPRPAHNPQLEKQYQRSVQQKIEQHKNYPRRAKRMRQQGIVKVGFSLSRNGAISNLRIIQSSGINSLDNATLQAVKKVGRFPTFPAGINKPSIGYIIPIAYRLN